MIEIRNLMFQPLTLHMAGEEGGVHLGSRERKTIADDQLSDEIRTAADRGFLSLADVPERTQPDPRVESADGEHSAVPSSEDQAAVRNRKRRQA